MSTLRNLKSLSGLSRHQFPLAKLMLRTMSSGIKYEYETLKVTTPKDYVIQVEINRPEKRNAMNRAFWREIRECFQKIAGDSDCRAVVLSAAGQVYTAGLDIIDTAGLLMQTDTEDVGRKAMNLRDMIRDFQESFTVIEKCSKPVIAAIHSACVGGGVDMVTACDIRYCSKDAWFQIKEVDIGLAADVGTLQRLPKVLGNDSLARELAYTARKLMADEAKEAGLVSKIFEDRESTINGALETASLIAEKSPIAVQGTKISLVYSRDHSVPEGLTHVGTWNQAMLQSEDLMKAAMANQTKEKATFSKL